MQELNMENLNKVVIKVNAFAIEYMELPYDKVNKRTLMCKDTVDFSEILNAQLNKDNQKFSFNLEINEPDNKNEWPLKYTCTYSFTENEMVDHETTCQSITDQLSNKGGVEIKKEIIIMCKNLSLINDKFL